MSRCIALLSVLFLTSGFAQSTTFVHIKEFPGTTIADRVASAMAQCPVAPVPCVLIVDTTLANLEPGTMPLLCSNCSLKDERIGAQRALLGSGPVATANMPAQFTSFAQPAFAVGPHLGAARRVWAAPTATLGIGDAHYAQGLAFDYVSANPVRGGMYSTQQMNQFSDYYAAMLSRSQGSHQLNGFFSVGLGQGDMIDHSGDLYCAGGSGQLLGGVSEPACQFSQPVIATWPFVFKATVRSPVTNGHVISYLPSQHENESAGARTLWNISRVYSAGTATYQVGSSPGVVRFSGNSDFTTMTPSPIGQLLVLGSSSQGYALNNAGQAAGARPIFAGYVNPGAVYAATVGMGGSGYQTGNQVTVSGCGNADAVFNVIADHGVVTGITPASIPTGSGYAVASGCAATGGAGQGLTIQIRQVTGVQGDVGKSCIVRNFIGGTGANGSASGQMSMLLTGPNSLSGAGFAASGGVTGYNNLVGATGATLSNGSAVCAGKITFSPASGPCSGDDVVIDGACWGHPQRVIAVLGPNQLLVEGNYDPRLTTANSPSVPYALIPSLPLTEIDTTSHTATALGRLLTATAVRGGSGITPGRYRLDAVGGLAAGMSCSTPPTVPTSGNLQCAQIEVVVDASGKVVHVVPTVSGGPVYVEDPSFSLNSSSTNLAGGTANCGATCPTFQAYLDTASIAAFQVGDTIAQPPDHRMAWNSTQAIYEPRYLDLGGGAVEKNLGPGQLYGAFTAQGDNGTGLGGWKYGFVDSAARLDYWANFAGQTVKFGMFYGPSASFGSAIWDYNGVKAALGSDFSGANLSALPMAGVSQPGQQPALFLSQQQALCAGNHGSTCAVAFSFKPSLNEPLHALAGSNPVPISSGLQSLYSFAVTDHVNSALAWIHSPGTLSSQVAILNGSTPTTSVVESLALQGGTVVRAVTPQTDFLHGIRLTSGQVLTSTDGVGSQIVTRLPGGTMQPSAMCGAAPAASGYYCDGFTRKWTQLTTYTATEEACQVGKLAKPCNVAHLALTSHNGLAEQSTALFTPKAAGLYRICGSLQLTAAALGGSSIALSPGFTSQGHYQGGQVMAATSTPALQWSYGSGCSVLMVDALTPVSLRLVFTNVTGSPSVSYGAAMEWLE